MRFGILSNTSTNAAAFINSGNTIEQTNPDADYFERQYTNGTTKLAFLEKPNSNSISVIDVANPAISNLEINTEIEHAKQIRDDLNDAKFSMSSTDISTRINEDNSFINECTSTSKLFLTKLIDNTSGVELSMKFNGVGFRIADGVSGKFAIHNDGKILTNQAIAPVSTGGTIFEVPMYDTSGAFLGYIKIYKA